jgi:EmrB/QacA subfamily drug resistance transporter
MTPAPLTSSWRAVALLVAVALFIEQIDATVIATAMPRMADSFGVKAVDLNVGITAYLSTMAVFILLSGWIADRIGTRRCFVLALTIFTLSSIWCAAISSLSSFTTARVFQGMGAALSVPVGRLIILRMTEKRDLMIAFAYLTWPALAAPVIAPPLGGFLTEFATWRWIFLINVPFGVIAIALALWLMPNQRSVLRVKLDAPGFILTAAACSSILYGLDQLGRDGIRPIQVAALLVIGVAIGVGALAHFRKTPEPLIDLSAMRIPTFALTVGSGSLYRIAINAVPFLLPLLFQVGFGMSPLSSGLLLLGLFAGNLLMKMATSMLLRRYGFRCVLVVNGWAVAVTIAACAAFDPGAPLILIALVLFLGGLARSLQFTALNTLAFADVPKEAISAANILSSVLGQLNSALGVAFAAFTLRMFMTVRHEVVATVPDFRWTFSALAALAAVSAVRNARLGSDAGVEVSRYNPSAGKKGTRSG